MGEYKLFRFGSLYLDETPQPISETYSETAHYQKGQKISIRDAVPGCAITWVKVKDANFLIADRNILYNINKKDLESQIVNLVLLNGWLYRVLLPEADFSDESKATWMHFLKQVGKDTLHFKGVRSFGTECNFHWSTNRPRKPVGFRPILMPVRPNVFSSGQVLTLDGQAFGIRQENMRLNRSGNINFEPVLYPLLTGENIASSKLLIDSGLLQNVSEMRAYTLLMDGRPVNQQTTVPTYKKGAKLELTDRFYGEKYLISWDIKNGCAYASRNILHNVPLEELYAQNLV